ncbi:hypothetical protein ACOMHN_055203 [Nucella lapillus]
MPSRRSGSISSPLSCASMISSCSFFDRMNSAPLAFLAMRIRASLAFCTCKSVKGGERLERPDHGHRHRG